MILKVKSNSTNIGTDGSASTVNDASVVTVLNTGTAPSKVTISSTPSTEVYVGAGERVIIEKDKSETLTATVSAVVYASAIGYNIS